MDGYNATDSRVISLDPKYMSYEEQLIRWMELYKSSVNIFNNEGQQVALRRIEELIQLLKEQAVTE